MSSVVTRLLAATLAGALLAAATAAVARSHGDPASELLFSQDVYAPTGGAEMTSIVGEANDRGFRIKVAVIAARSDLGEIEAFWRKPQPYARYLGQDLRSVFRGRLLVVMPTGYGIYHHGTPVAGERRVLDRLPPPGASGDDLASATTEAVRRLARARGVSLAAPGTSGENENRDRLVLAAVALGIGAAGATALAARRRRRGRRAAVG